MADVAEQQKIELQVPTTLKALVEALIFAAQQPLTIAELKAIYQGERRNETSRLIEAETIRQAVNDLNDEYAKAGRPYRIIQIAGGFQFATVKEYADWIGKLYREQGRRKLSQSGIETLAIIAYKQPITKSEVEAIRGVNCDYVLKSLLEKELVTVMGRAETVGRPLLYGTTREFLKYFGLNEITDLPRPREIEEILGESQFETERRMLEAQAGIDQMKKEQEDFKSRLPHIPKRKSELDQKEVEIVQRKKSWEIKTISTQPSQTQEVAEQERMKFVPPAVSEEPTNAANVVPPAEAEMTQAQEGAMPQTVVPPRSESAQEDLSISGDTRLESPKSIEHESPIEHQVDADSGVDDATHQQKTRWQNWKEKLSGFIKKIFG
ncbi:MAG: SMC-Scp complex subunit ScpB [Ignavibacteriales bacterium]|nr:SMC-Scp complex subunit ScpB [Ignavibacteriales bacterium]